MFIRFPRIRSAIKKQWEIDTMVDKVEMKELDSCTQEHLMDLFRGHWNFARFGDIGCLLPMSYKEDADYYKNMVIRSDDVLVATFPRSGTTWTSELVWLLVNDLDYGTALTVSSSARCWFLERKHLVPVSSSIIPPSPRCLKTHIPMSLLPSNVLDSAKMVYVARDPRDVAVSFYHFSRLIMNYSGDFKTYWNLFINDLVLCSPFFPHLKQAWALRNHPNMLFIFYEDMIRDLPLAIKHIANFLGKKLTDEKIAKLCEHLDIKNFRKNESVNPSWIKEIGNPDAEGFVRKGRPNFARFGDIGCLLPITYKEGADYYKNMVIRSKNVLVATFPRSGSTWTSELVWLLVNDLDYDTASKVSLSARCWFLERKHLAPVTTPTTPPSPRCLKTHIPMSLLPSNVLDTAKMVYVARDPRDVAVSFYHFSRLLKNYSGDFKTYWNLFINDLVLCSPFFPHLKEAWALRDHPNMLFIFYEDMTRNLPSAIKRIANFLGKKLTDEEIAKLCEHLDIKNFRKNGLVNPSWIKEIGNPDAEGFVRKGKSGGWRDHFDGEMTAQALQWMRDNLAGSDLRFPDASTKLAI